MRKYIICSLPAELESVTTSSFSLKSFGSVEVNRSKPPLNKQHYGRTEPLRHPLVSCSKRHDPKKEIFLGSPAFLTKI